MSYSGIGDEEHLVLSIITRDGTVIEEEDANKMMELPAEIVGAANPEGEELVEKRNKQLQIQDDLVQENNKKYYLDECDKLDAYSEDLKDGLKFDVRELKKAISERKKVYRASTNLPLADIVAMQDEINKMEVKLKKMRREIYIKEDEIDAEKESLQEEIKQKLNGKSNVKHIMSLSFEIV